MSTHLIIPDSHSIPGKNNNRAEWVGRLICDVKPDVVVHLGDGADMPSLSSYDRGHKSFQGRTYKADIQAHTDFQDRLWSTVRKQKRKMPRRVYLIGNHEQRIERAVNVQPELDGTISYDDLELSTWYDDVVHYKGGTPGVIDIDDIYYAHYFVSGVMGRSISGEHPAYSLLTRKHKSCTQGHTHTYDHCFRTDASGKPMFCLVAGMFADFELEYAGEVNDLWWRGVFIKRNVDKGSYDLEAVSMSRLKREYGNVR